jgi:homogentisate phytyltransferase/homogentisate geranylgeranyltransferase
VWPIACSLALGIFYSADVPLLRWKRSPFLAAACIFGVRALAVQFGFYLHMTSTVLQRCACSHAGVSAAVRLMRQFMCADACRIACCDSEPALTFPLLFASGFMSIFSVVIAFFKDIPDVKGDKRSAIQTLPVRLGVSACAPSARGCSSTAACLHSHAAPRLRSARC